MNKTLPQIQDAGVEVLPSDKLVDLDYADNIIILFDNRDVAQNRLTDVIPSFGMKFAPTKLKILLQDHPPLTPKLRILNEDLDIVERFTHLSVNNLGNMSDEVRIRIAKAIVAFSNLRHLWRNANISLRLKCRVYNASVRAVLLYASETWPLRVDDLRRLQAFDHRCLRSIAHVGYQQRLINVDIRRRIFGSDK